MSSNSIRIKDEDGKIYELPNDLAPGEGGWTPGKAMTVMNEFKGVGPSGKPLHGTQTVTVEEPGNPDFAAVYDVPREEPNTSPFQYGKSGLTKFLRGSASTIEPAGAPARFVMNKGGEALRETILKNNPLLGVENDTIISPMLKNVPVIGAIAGQPLKQGLEDYYKSLDERIAGSSAPPPENMWTSAFRMAPRLGVGAADMLKSPEMVSLLGTKFIAALSNFILPGAGTAYEVGMSGSFGADMSAGALNKVADVVDRLQESHEARERGDTKTANAIIQEQLKTGAIDAAQTILFAKGGLKHATGIGKNIWGDAKLSQYIQDKISNDKNLELVQRRAMEEQGKANAADRSQAEYEPEAWAGEALDAARQRDQSLEAAIKENLDRKGRAPAKWVLDRLVAKPPPSPMRDGFGVQSLPGADTRVPVDSIPKDRLPGENAQPSSLEEYENEKIVGKQKASADEYFKPLDDSLKQIVEARARADGKVPQSHNLLPPLLPERVGIGPRAVGEEQGPAPEGEVQQPTAEPALGPETALLAPPAEIEPALNEILARANPPLPPLLPPIGGPRLSLDTAEQGRLRRGGRRKGGQSVVAPEGLGKPIEQGIASKRTMLMPGDVAESQGPPTPSLADALKRSRYEGIDPSLEKALRDRFEQERANGPKPVEQLGDRDRVPEPVPEQPRGAGGEVPAVEAGPGGGAVARESGPRDNELGGAPSVQPTIGRVLRPRSIGEEFFGDKPTPIRGTARELGASTKADRFGRVGEADRGLAKKSESSTGKSGAARPGEPDVPLPGDAELSAATRFGEKISPSVEDGAMVYGTRWSDDIMSTLGRASDRHGDKGEVVTGKAPGVVRPFSLDKEYAIGSRGPDGSRSPMKGGDFYRTLVERLKRENPKSSDSDVAKMASDTIVGTGFDSFHYVDENGGNVWVTLNPEQQTFKLRTSELGFNDSRTFRNHLEDAFPGQSQEEIKASINFTDTIIKDRWRARTGGSEKLFWSYGAPRIGRVTGEEIGLKKGEFTRDGDKKGKRLAAETSALYESGGTGTVQIRSVRGGGSEAGVIIHELIHAMDIGNLLTKSELAALEGAYGKDWRTNKISSERIAYDFIRHLAHERNNPKLVGIFGKLGEEIFNEHSKKASSRRSDRKAYLTGVDKALRPVYESFLRGDLKPEDFDIDPARPHLLVSPAAAKISPRSSDEIEAAFNKIQDEKGGPKQTIEEKLREEQGIRPLAEEIEREPLGAEIEPEQRERIDISPEEYGEKRRSIRDIWVRENRNLNKKLSGLQDSMGGSKYEAGRSNDEWKNLEHDLRDTRNEIENRNYRYQREIAMVDEEYRISLPKKETKLAAPGKAQEQTPEFKQWSKDAPVVDFSSRSIDDPSSVILRDHILASKQREQSLTSKVDDVSYEISKRRREGPADGFKDFHMEKTEEINRLADEIENEASYRSGLNNQAKSIGNPIDKELDVKTGRPVVAVVYHGSDTSDFTSFDPIKRGYNTDAPSAMQAFFFSGDPEMAAGYISHQALNVSRRHDERIKEGKASRTSAGVQKHYVRMLNPLVRDYKGEHYREETFNDLITRAKNSGHDGVIVENAHDPGGGIYGEGMSKSNIVAVWDPKQIKSAIGNKGTFDDSPNALAAERSVGQTLREMGAKPPSGTGLEAGERKPLSAAETFAKWKGTTPQDKVKFESHNSDMEKLASNSLSAAASIIGRPSPSRSSIYEKIFSSDEGGKVGKIILRRLMAESERYIVSRNEALRVFKEDFDKRSGKNESFVPEDWMTEAMEIGAKNGIDPKWLKKHAEELQFMSIMDDPKMGVESIKDPNLRAFATQARRDINGVLDEIEELGGLDNRKRFLDTYWKHNWNNTAEEIAKAANKWRDQRQSISGSKAFMKERSIPTFKEGIALGLRPEDANPIVTHIKTLREMQRYLTGLRLLRDLEKSGDMLIMKHSEADPHGYRMPSDPLFQKKVPDKIKDENGKEKKTVPNSRYVVPTQLADILDNYASSRNLLDELGGKGYRALRWGANNLVAARLGLSLFHVGFVLNDAANSGLSLAAVSLANGDFGSATRGLMQAIPVVGSIRTYMLGKKIDKAWLGDESVGPETMAIAKFIELGGGRNAQDRTFWENKIEKLSRSWNKRDVKGIATGIPLAVLDSLSYVVMEHVVPKIKLGVAGDLAMRELTKLSKETGKDSYADALASVDINKVAQIAGKTWDSVDNRLGQVVYDNLFWSKTNKAVLHLLVQSVGWNLGTIRELGGGVKDLVRIFQPEIDIEGKKMNRLTDRTAYALSLPIYTAIMGGMMNYLYTGEPPQDANDLFFPRNGKINPDGTKQRIAPPTYVKDVVSFFGGFVGPRGSLGRGAKQMATVVSHKLNPIWSTMVDYISNKDFYGREVRDDIGDIKSPEDYLRFVTDTAKFTLKSFIPYGVQGYKRQKQASGEDVPSNPLKAAADYVTSSSFYGYQPASAAVTRTPFSMELSDAIRKTRGTPLSTEQASRSELKRDILSKMRAGKVEEAEASMAEIKQGYLLSEKEMKKLGKDARGSAIQTSLGKLPLSKVLEIYKLGDEDEQAEALPAVVKKFKAARSGRSDELYRMPPEKRQQTLEEALEIIQGPPPEKKKPTGIFKYLNK